MSRTLKVILLIDSSRPSGRAILSGIARYAQRYGPWSFGSDLNGRDAGATELRALQADGIIQWEAEESGHSSARKSAERGPRVGVITDSRMIGRMGAEHLLGRGYQQFAFLGYAQKVSAKASRSEIRREFFSRRIRKAGFETPAHYAIPAGRQGSEEERRLVRWLESLPKPAGLMACDDECSRQVIDACKLAGLPVPGAVGVIGADHDEVLCGLSDPPLSSIAINYEWAGYEAARALDLLMRGSSATPRKIVAAAFATVSRRSTDLERFEEPYLTKSSPSIHTPARDVSAAEIYRLAGSPSGAPAKRSQRMRLPARKETVRIQRPSIDVDHVI